MNILKIVEKASNALQLYNQCIHSPIDDIQSKLARQMSEIFSYQEGRNPSSVYFDITEKFFLKEMSKGHANFFDIVPYAIFSLFDKMGDGAIPLQDKIEGAGLALDFFDLQIGTIFQASSKLHKSASFAANCLHIARILSFMLELNQNTFNAKDIDSVYHFYFYKRLRVKYQLVSCNISIYDVCYFDFHDIDVWVVKHLLQKFHVSEIIEMLDTYSPGYFLSRNTSYGYLILADALGIDFYIEI